MTAHHELSTEVTELKKINDEFQSSLSETNRLGQALALATAVVCDKAARLIVSSAPTLDKKPITVGLNVDLGGTPPERVCSAIGDALEALSAKGEPGIVQLSTPTQGACDAAGKAYANKVAASGAFDELKPFVKAADEATIAGATGVNLRPAYAGRTGVIEPGCNRPHVPAAPPSRPTPPAAPSNPNALGRGGDPKAFFQAKRVEEPAAALATSQKAFDRIADEIKETFLRTVRGDVVKTVDYIAQLRAEAGNVPDKIDDARRALRQAISTTMAKPVASIERDLHGPGAPRKRHGGDGPSVGVKVLCHLRSVGEQRAQQIASAISESAGNVSERLTRYGGDGFVKKAARRGFWLITPNGIAYLKKHGY